MLRGSFCFVLLAGFLTLTPSSEGQEKSVKPGINDAFRNPDLKKYLDTFEGESREIFTQRDAVLRACGVREGMSVADIGAGTGLYTRLFAAKVGPAGTVFAVDIAEKFLEHIRATSKEAKLGNVKTILCKPDSAELPANSVDLVFICDTYHHFEFPQRTLASIHKALKPGGTLVLIDFIREEGKSREWIVSHVRAGQGTFEKEIAEAGFRKRDEEKGLLKENYFVRFDKVDTELAKKLVFPLIAGYGGVVPLRDAVEAPAKGGKVVFDVTAGAKDPTRPAPGLERAAVLLNLAGSAGLKAADLEVAVVLHGDATAACLTEEAHRVRFGRANPNADLIGKLATVGVKILVCGQSLERKHYETKELLSEVKHAASAVSAVVNLQNCGYAFVPAHEIK